MIGSIVLKNGLDAIAVLATPIADRKVDYTNRVRKVWIGEEIN